MIIPSSTDHTACPLGCHPANDRPSNRSVQPAACSAGVSALAALPPATTGVWNRAALRVSRGPENSGIDDWICTGRLNENTATSAVAHLSREVTRSSL
jgi:hypothetical protein